MKNILCILFIVASASKVSAMEMPITTTNCHCFQERVFDPQKKFVADQYLLTTSFNSFLAVNFAISKRRIVMLKMKGGIAPGDLLVGLYVAREGGVKLESVLAVLKNGGTMAQVLASDSLQWKGRSRGVLDKIKASLESEDGAVAVVTDQLLKEYFGISDRVIWALRAGGGSGREVVLVSLLARYATPSTPAAAIMEMYRAGGKSWAEIADSFGLSPKATGRLLRPLK